MAALPPQERPVRGQVARLRFYLARSPLNFISAAAAQNVDERIQALRSSTRQQMTSPWLSRAASGAAITGLRRTTA